MPDFNFSEITKKGWHPKGKDGKSKESWRGDFKGLDQISGWMGKAKGETPKEDGDAGGSSYTPMPISSLRDPASFAPPPKRVPGGRASPGTNPAGGSAYAPPSSRQPEPEAEEERPPPQPYRRDTTGLSTAHLPPPPGRRDGADGRVPAAAAAPRPPAMKPKPSLPPRLPPRQTEHVDEHTPAAPPPYSLEAEPPSHHGILNQNAMNRLGAAGISVPGFGIAPSPSPPLPSRRQNATPPPPVSPKKPGTSQLGELQSRFAKLGNASPQKEQPAATTEGTTWAQKQAALKTASSFRNNPSSVSFSDARSAASTANNFRERHGAQVASGLQSANNLNNKYGLTDKAAAYGGGSRVPEQARDPSNGINMDGHCHSVPFKKAPPPPPKKPELVAAQPSTGPPPIPHSSKPKPPPVPPRPHHLHIPHLHHHKPPPLPTDLDLDLKGNWYSLRPPIWPPPHLAHHQNKALRFNGYSIDWASYDGFVKHRFTGVVVYNNLSRTKLHIKYDGVDPQGTARETQLHYPPPRELGKEELEAYRRLYGERIARCCESQKGEQVGNGECWTLVNEALKAVAEECKKKGEEECMLCIGFVHGYLLYSHKYPHKPEPRSFKQAGVARGDIMQLYNAKFQGEHGWKTAGDPDHTVVVVGVDVYGREGRLTVLEQNNGTDKIVRESEYLLSELCRGEVKIFRPVGISWMGDLNPSWPSE